MCALLSHTLDAISRGTPPPHPPPHPPELALRTDAQQSSAEKSQKSAAFHRNASSQRQKFGFAHKHKLKQKNLRCFEYLLRSRATGRKRRHAEFISDAMLTRRAVLRPLRGIPKFSVLFGWCEWLHCPAPHCSSLLLTAPLPVQHRDPASTACALLRSAPLKGRARLCRGGGGGGGRGRSTAAQRIRDELYGTQLWSGWMYRCWF